MAVPRKFVSRLIIFSDKGYFEIVLFSTSISIGYHASTLNFLACIANSNVHIENNIELTIPHSFRQTGLRSCKLIFTDSYFARDKYMLILAKLF